MRNMGIVGYFYFGQGYSLASLVLLIPLYIKDVLGVGDYSHAVTISVIIIIPWYFKVLFGVLSDNFPISVYRRKPYLAIATVFSIVGWLTIGIHTSANTLFVLSGVCIAIGSALADSVVDGIAVEMTPPEFIGRLQGVAWGSRGLGIGITGVISSQIVDHYGWQQMFYVSSIFGITISFIALFLPSTGFGVITNRIARIKESFTHILNKNLAFEELQYFFWSGTALCIVPLLTVIMDREFHYSIVEIGYGSLIFAIGSFIGAIINGIVFDKAETQRNLTLLFCGFGFSYLLDIVFLLFHGIIIEVIFLIFVGGAAGAFESYQLKIIQEATTEGFESTGFAVYTGVSNIGQFAIGAVFIVYLSEWLNVSFFIPMLILLVCVWIAYRKILKIKSLD